MNAPIPSSVLAAAHQRAAQERAAIFAMTDPQVLLTMRRIKRPHLYLPAIRTVRREPTARDRDTLEEILTRVRLDAKQIGAVLADLHAAVDIDRYHLDREDEADALRAGLENLCAEYQAFAEGGE